ncbi:hypothetical protein RB595_001122 [Gaeumannomyces hyphopodioides]
MDLQTYETEKAEFLDQLEAILAGLQDDPENEELLVLKSEVEEALALCNEQIAELQPSQPTATPAPAAASKPTLEQRSRADNAGSHKSGPAPPSLATPDDKEPEASYQVNDNVMAKWVSGDKAFYAAHITSVTGSSTAPIYTVKFKSYDTVETLRARDIRPVAPSSSSAQKRKADGTPVAAPELPHAAAAAPQQQPAAHASNPQPAVSRNNNGVVLSASATRYVQPQGGADGEGSEAAGADGAKPVKKFKKIKATKELEKGKSNWQDFNNKSKFGKSQKKDSMFRTPEGIHGRVGFTGSGQAMRKDPSRSRHIYQPNEELD